MNGELTSTMGSGEGHQALATAYFKFERVGASETMSSVWDTYEEWLNDPDPDVRRKAIHHLGSMHHSSGSVNDNVLLALDHFAKHPDPISRLFVASSLGKRYEHTIPLLSLLSMDSDQRVREWAAGNLGNAGASAIQVIKRLVHDPEARVRTAAASSLCLLKNGRLLLLRLLFHQDEGVRQWAKVGLWGESKASLGFLESTAETWDPVGLNARVVLERMGRGKEWIEYILNKVPERQEEEPPTSPVAP